MDPATPEPRLRPFVLLWAGQAVSLLGTHAVQFALVWWLAQSTGSAALLATSTLLALLPAVVVGPLAGTLVDRWNRRRTML
jgi:DHA3 family macrolide efflux protein-like MFS transporter